MRASARGRSSFSRTTGTVANGGLRGPASGWGKKAAALTVPQVRVLLQAVLPRRRLDAATALALVDYVQRQNYAAYRSHRKRTLHRHNTS